MISSAKFFLPYSSFTRSLCPSLTSRLVSEADEQANKTVFRPTLISSAQCENYQTSSHGLINVFETIAVYVIG